jgi:hypothetical protein
MADRKSYHVIASLSGGWSVVKNGAERASKNFSSQADAIQWARRVSSKQSTELFIHRTDGTVERRDSYMVVDRTDLAVSETTRRPRGLRRLS